MRAAICASSVIRRLVWAGRWNWKTRVIHRKALRRLTVNHGAVATSSVAKRTWKQGEKSRHHIIDPRTGEPAQSHWLCATVMADDTVTAEVYAKALLIGEPAEVEKLTAKNNIVYLVVDREGNLHGSPNSQEYIREHESIRP